MQVGDRRMTEDAETCCSRATANSLTDPVDGIMVSIFDISTSKSDKTHAEVTVSKPNPFAFKVSVNLLVDRLVSLWKKIEVVSVGLMSYKFSILEQAAGSSNLLVKQSFAKLTELECSQYDDHCARHLSIEMLPFVVTFGGCSGAMVVVTFGSVRDEGGV